MTNRNQPLYFCLILNIGMLLIASVNCFGMSDTIGVVSSEDIYAKTLVEVLSRKIKPSEVNLTAETINDLPLIITLGNDKTSISLDNYKGWIINSFSNPHSNSNQANVIRIYNSPSPQSTAFFLGKYFPKSKIGYITLDVNDAYLQGLEIHQNSCNIEIISEIYDGDTLSTARRLINKGIDVMLVTKNVNVYQANTLRPLLETFFRKRIPVVSTSEKLIPAGATVAVTANTDDVIDSTIKIVNEVKKGHQVHQDNYPERNKIIVNQALLKLYGLGEMNNEN